ncbi:hypothetical protein EDD85DRAFT_786363 [Armillaria nabsnona]|nr:hypothetical protein EDD85DRAFT_786363 [Armillaria nabsnona]
MFDLHLAINYLSYKYGEFSSSYSHPVMPNQLLLYSSIPLRPPAFLVNRMLSSLSPDNYRTTPAHLARARKAAILSFRETLLLAVLTTCFSPCKEAKARTIYIAVANLLQLVVKASCKAGFETMGAFLFAPFTGPDANMHGMLQSYSASLLSFSIALKWPCWIALRGVYTVGRVPDLCAQEGQADIVGLALIVDEQQSGQDSNISPALFAITSACALNKENHKQFEEAANNDSNVLPLSVTPTTAPAFDTVSSGVPTIMRTEPWLGVIVAILALLHLRYTHDIIFPTLTGIFIFTLQFFQAFKFLSWHQISRQSAYTRLWCHPTFQILFDNVNTMKRTWRQSLGHDGVKSGTAVTLVKLEDIPPRALEAEGLLQNI